MVGHAPWRRAKRWCAHEMCCGVRAPKPDETCCLTNKHSTTPPNTMYHIMRLFMRKTPRETHRRTREIRKRRHPHTLRSLTMHAPARPTQRAIPRLAACHRIHPWHQQKSCSLGPHCKASLQKSYSVPRAARRGCRPAARLAQPPSVRRRHTSPPLLRQGQDRSSSRRPQLAGQCLAQQLHTVEGAGGHVSTLAAAWARPHARARSMHTAAQGLGTTAHRSK